MHKKAIMKLTYSALCLALALVLPFLTGQIPRVGSMLCPMHIPVLLCGMLCGWPCGMAVGAAAPLLRSALFGGMPPFMTALAMTFELAAYGLISGLLHKRLPKNTSNIYLSLIVAMTGGRIVWGIVSFALAGLRQTTFPFSAFVAGAVTNAIPGIILHILLIPVIVMALKKAKLMLNE